MKTTIAWYALAVWAVVGATALGQPTSDLEKKIAHLEQELKIQKRLAQESTMTAQLVRASSLRSSDAGMALKLLDTPSMCPVDLRGIEWHILRSACNRETPSLKGHRSSVRSLTVSPDGKHVFSGSNDGAIKLWNLSTGKETRTFEGHGGEVNQVAVTPDGTTLASAADDNTVRIWEVETGKTRHVLKGHSAFVLGVGMTADGRTAVSVSHDGNIKTWNIVAGKELHSVKVGRKLWSMAISPDGNTLAVGSDGPGLIFRKNANDRWEQQKMPQFFSAPATMAVAISPDGQTLLVPGPNNAVRLIALGGKGLGTTLPAHPSTIMGLSFSADGKTFASASSCGTIFVYTLTGFPRQIDLLRSPDSRTVSMVLNADGKRVFSGGHDNLIHQFVTKPQVVAAPGFARAEPGIPATFKTDGTLVSLVDDGKKALVLLHEKIAPGGKPESGDKLVSWDLLTNAKKTIAELGPTFHLARGSADGKRILHGGPYSPTLVYEVDTNKKIDWPVPAKELSTGLRIPPVASADGTQLACGLQSGQIHLWDQTTAKRIRTISASGCPVFALAFSPDGKLIAEGNFDHAVRIWDTKTGENRGSFSHVTSVKFVAWSADSKRVLSAAQDLRVLIHDLETAKLVCALQENDSPLLAAAFSPDGSSVATVHTKGVIRLWSAHTGQLRLTLQSTGTTNRVLFSPDGRRLFASDASRNIEVWGQ